MKSFGMLPLAVFIDNRNLLLRPNRVCTSRFPLMRNTTHKTHLNIADVFQPGAHALDERARETANAMGS
jgi:hypothetical protein